MLHPMLIRIVLCLAASPFLATLAQKSPSASLFATGSASNTTALKNRDTVVHLLVSLPEKHLGCAKLTLEQLQGSSDELETDFINLYFLRRPDSNGKCKTAITLFRQTLGPPYVLAVQNLSRGFQGLPTFLEFRRGRWLDVTKRVLPSFVLRLERLKIKSRLARDGSGLLVAPFDETDDFSKLLYTLEWKRGHFWPLEMKTSSQVFRP